MHRLKLTDVSHSEDLWPDLSLNAEIENVSEFENVSVVNRLERDPRLVRVPKGGMVDHEHQTCVVVARLHHGQA